MVCLTYPHIGNVGSNIDDEESPKPYIEGLVVREFSALASNWRSTETAQKYLERHGVPVIWDMDTRALVRHLRQFGALRGMVATDETPAEALIVEAKALPTMAGQELASRVSSAKKYEWKEGSIGIASPILADAERDAAGGKRGRRRVVAYDFGIKQNILRLLVDHDCDVTVVPAQTSAEDVLALKPDGVFLSNGPGDPEPIHYAVVEYSETFGARADFWDLPGASIVRAGAGWEDVQVEVRTSRRESSGAEFADEEGGDYVAEPWILRGPGVVALERSGNHACEFQ